MGSSSSRPEKGCVYSTPKKIREELVIDVSPESVDCSTDPRSPHICRTPIEKVLGRTEACLEALKITSPQTQPEQNPSDLLRSKLIRELQLNMHDPRSPSLFINRTPIVFDEEGDKLDSTDCAMVSADTSLNLDDEFADLFIENELPPVPAVDVDKNDPRSPSIGVERTPINLVNNVENDADAIESVLEVLKINTKLENKPLERVKNPKAYRAVDRKKTIYEDKEQIFSTPRRAKGDAQKRTPLSCMANKAHLRSRSVENTNKSKKPRIVPTSFDDNSIELEVVVNAENVLSNC